MRITLSLMWWKFSSKQKGRYDEIKKSEKPKLGDAPVGHPSKFKKTQASKLGDAQGIPFFIRSEELRVGKECRL